MRRAAAAALLLLFPLACPHGYLVAVTRPAIISPSGSGGRADGGERRCRRFVYSLQIGQRSAARDALAT